MTQMNDQNIDCPKCGHTQNVTVWNSINVSLNPELKEDLYKGQINMFKCDACEETVFISTPLLYHDMDKGFCVHYFPFQAIQDGSDILMEYFTEEGRVQMEDNPLDPRMEYYFDPQIVFSPQEMVRYVMFREVLHEKKMGGKH